MQGMLAGQELQVPDRFVASLRGVLKDYARAPVASLEDVLPVMP